MSHCLLEVPEDLHQHVLSSAYSVMLDLNTLAVGNMSMWLFEDDVIAIEEAESDASPGARTALALGTGLAAAPSKVESMQPT